jgi:hypothetical protein
MATIRATENPTLASQLINEALGQAEQVETRELKPMSLPASPFVELPGGYITDDDDLITTAEVRELTGEDEEYLARINGAGKLLLAILERGVVKIGDLPVTKKILDDMLAGDREAIILGIRRVTFGDTIEFTSTCPICNVADLEFMVDLSRDVPVVELEDRMLRNFKVSCKAGDVVIELPTGRVQKKLVSAQDKSGAELDSILLSESIVSIDGMPLLDPLKRVKKLGIQDRRKITALLVEKTPGPQMAEVKISCPSCGQEVPLPLSLADLFQL